jgi:hypothetical protein
MHPGPPERGDVAGEDIAQLGPLHRGAAILDDHRLPREDRDRTIDRQRPRNL